MRTVPRLFDALLLALAALPARAADPDVLWKIVHEQCVPDERLHADPAPCAVVSPEGWVMLKDHTGRAQFLLLPTARITGIEDPAILAADAPNYWQAAWDGRWRTMAALGKTLPRDDIALAVNSPLGRTQNQLHIHIDCVRADVRAALTAHMGAIGTDWATFPVPLNGHHYLARRLESEALRPDPFRLLEDARQVNGGSLRDWTLVVVGAAFPDGRNGFVLLADRIDKAAGDRAAGEELQDHDCRLANAPN